MFFKPSHAHAPPFPRKKGKSGGAHPPGGLNQGQPAGAQDATLLALKSSGFFVGVALQTLPLTGLQLDVLEDFLTFLAPPWPTPASP